MNETIKITDLIKPILTEQQKAVIEFGKSFEVKLDATDILEEAKNTLSLDDFGSMDFLPRLELLCDEWGSDRGNTNIGKLNLRNKLVQFAKNRLLITDLLSTPPRNSPSRNQTAHYCCWATSFRNNTPIKLDGG